MRFLLVLCLMAFGPSVQAQVLSPAETLQRCLASNYHTTSPLQRPGCFTDALNICTFQDDPKPCMSDVEQRANAETDTVVAGLPPTHPDPRLDQKYRAELSLFRDNELNHPFSSFEPDAKFSSNLCVEPDQTFRGFCDAKVAIHRYAMALFLEDMIGWGSE